MKNNNNNKVVEDFKCAGIALVLLFSIVIFWACFGIILYVGLWKYPFQTALISTGLAVIIFCVGFITDLHNNKMRRH